MSRHRNNPKPPRDPRMDQNDRLQQVTPVGTDRATVRGVEDEGSKETLSKGKCKASKKKNRIRGISDRKKDKDNDREGTNYGDMRKQGPACVAQRSGDGTVAGMPSLGQHTPPPLPTGAPPNPPMATTW